MKPRTKIEHRVLSLSNGLNSITEIQEKYSVENYLPHLGFANKSRGFCLDCGEEFPIHIISRKRCICPSCGTKLKIENTRKTTHRLREYFAIAELHSEFQVIRYFEIKASYKNGYKANIIVREILQDWISTDHKLTMVGLNHYTVGNCDSWTGDWEIRKAPTSYYHHNKYNVYVEFYHPASVFKGEYRKYGIDRNLKGITFLEAIKMIPNDSKAETLLKARQYSLLDYNLNHSGRIHHRWPSIKICLRNKYKVKDASMWFDYIDLLSHFNKDLRNAKFVCPQDLKKEHDRLVKKKRSNDRKREIELQRQRTKAAQKQYAKSKKPFMGMKFIYGDMEIKFLNSVQEVMEEGDVLKHCVFVNNYHEKETLLFSVLVDGEKTATAEVDPFKHKIIQVRGKSNSVTKYDSQIKNILRKNMDVISSKISKPIELEKAS